MNRQRTDTLRTLLLLLAVLLTAPRVLAGNQPVEELLDSFDQSRSVETANQLLEQLHQLEFFDQPIRFEQDAPADSVKQQVWYWMAEYFYDRQHYQQAVEYAKRAQHLFHVDDERADCLSLISISYTRLGDYSKAAEYARQCHQIDLKSGDDDRISSSLNTLASIYLYANQPKEAAKYVLRGISMAEETGNRKRLAILLGKASEIYHSMGNDTAAVQYADQAYAIDNEDGREDKAAIRLSQKAAALIGLQRYDEAERVLAAVIPQFRKEDNRQSLGIACNKMGQSLLAQQRQAEAVPFYREAASIFAALGDPYNEVQARRGLYEALWDSNPDEAHRQLEHFNALKDSIYSNTSAENLARYNAEFGNNWLQLEAHKQRTAKWQAVCVGLAMALFLTALAISVWYVMRKRNRRQAAINQQLSEHIAELREQYRQLNIQYDNALKTTPTKTDIEEVSPSDRDFLEKTINVINEQIYSGQVNAKSVAEQMGLSLFQFRQRLSTVTDETPQSFIQLVRMQRARHLLDHRPELNITEVANLCAYNDTPNFTRAFKAAFGVTPTQYSKRNTSAADAE